MMAESWKRPIQGILLDAVGTLIEPCPPVALAYATAARRQGVELGTDLVRSRFHKHFGADEVDEMGGPMTTNEPRERRRWRRIVSAVLPEVPDPDQAFEELWGHFGGAGAWSIYPDVRGSLHALETMGIAVRIASNFDGRLRSVLGGMPSLSPWVSAIVISSEIGYRKPHPRFYALACESLLLPPDRVLCVGDDLENDVLGPRRAGLQSILLDRDGTQAPGDDRLTSLGELVARMQGLHYGPN